MNWLLAKQKRILTELFPPFHVRPIYSQKVCPGRAGLDSPGVEWMNKGAHPVPPVWRGLPHWKKSQLTQLARVIDPPFCFWLARHKNDRQNISSRKRRVITKRDGNLRNHHRWGWLLVLMWDQDSTRPPFLFVSVSFGMDTNRRAVGNRGNFKWAAPVSSFVKWK